MDFFIDLISLAILIIVFTAGLGIISTKLAQLLVGSKGHDIFERNLHTKQGWKQIERKE